MMGFRGDEAVFALVMLHTAAMNRFREDLT